MTDELLCNIIIYPGDYEDDVCSSDEEEIRNRIGNIPIEWYDDYDHIGYDVMGQKVTRTAVKGWLLNSTSYKVFYQFTYMLHLMKTAHV